MNAHTVERVLMRREQHLVFWWILCAAGFAASVGLSVLLFLHPVARSLVHGAPFVVAYVAFLRALWLADGQANRDRLARPLLSSLPLTPAMTLGGPSERAMWLGRPPSAFLAPASARGDGGRHRASVEIRGRGQQGPFWAPWPCRPWHS